VSTFGEMLREALAVLSNPLELVARLWSALVSMFDDGGDDDNWPSGAPA